MSAEAGQTLSREGAARRDAIFEQLVLAQRQRTRRRHATRVGSAVLVLVAAGLAGWAALHNGSIGVPAPRLTQSGPSALEPDGGNAHRSAPSPRVQPPSPIQIVANDPTVLDRLTAKPDAGRASIIGDDELDGLLARAGKTPGFIRTPGRFILAADVPQPKAPGNGRS